MLTGRHLHSQIDFERDVVLGQHIGAGAVGAVYEGTFRGRKVSQIHPIPPGRQCWLVAYLHAYYAADMKCMLARREGGSGRDPFTC